MHTPSLPRRPGAHHSLENSLAGVQCIESNALYLYGEATPDISREFVLTHRDPLITRTTDAQASTIHHSAYTLLAGYAVLFCVSFKLRQPCGRNFFQTKKKL